MSVPKDIRKVFDTLDRWRHLPAYQLERRVDIFFAMYLPHVLKVYLNVEIKKYLIPEFPIKKEKNNQSYKADYFAISKDGKRAFLIELKTDMKSRGDTQDKIYRRARDRGLYRLVKGVISIRYKTEKPKKYDYLLDHLAKLDLVRVEERKPKNKRYNNAVRKLEPRIKVLYILPKNTPKKPSSADYVITFCQFADAIEGRGEVATLFAGYLRHWASIKAGD